MTRSFRIPGSRRQYPPDREYRTSHIDLKVAVDFNERRLAGESSLTIVAVRDGLRSFHVDACEMQIVSVRIDGAPTRFEYDGRRITIEPERPLDALPLTVSISYSTVPRRGGYFVLPDEAFPKKPTQFWTHSETEYARYWYPCNDRPDDKSTSEIAVTVPVGYTVISNGRLTGVQKSGGLETHTWKESVPHSTYLNSVVVGVFEEIREEHNGIPIVYYFMKSDKENAYLAFRETPEMVNVFEKLLDTAYPFEKYASVSVQDFIFGGMEHVSATTLTDNRFPDKRSLEDFAASYSRPDRTHRELLSHELAHQWLGDLVTLRDWPHAWLNEGFATYLEAMYVESKFGVDEFRKGMEYKAESAIEEDTKRYRRRIVENEYIYSDDLFDNTTYDKGAWMLHQLRHIVGDEPFLRGVQEFVKRFALKSADTDDFRKTMEDVTGHSLKLYFEQAFDKGGYPEFEVEYSWDEAKSTAGLLVKQVQKTDDLTPVFRLPADIVFYTKSGRQVRAVDISLSQERFSFSLDSRPVIVEFDPQGWLLMKTIFRKSQTLLANQIKFSLDASSRSRAADDLSVFRSDEVIDLLEEALQKEQFWDVRAKAARSLGKIGTGRALEALRRAATIKHRKVRRAVVEALSNFKDQRLDDLLATVLLNDESPYVQCEAALSLAKTGKGRLEDFKAAMEIPSPNNTLAEACLEAIGYTKSEEAKMLLAESLKYGKPVRERIGALKGLAKRGYVQEDEVTALKEILLHDKQYPVRYQVLSTIEDLGDKRFIETLKEASDGDNDSRIRRRAIELYHQLSAETESLEAVSKLRAEVEKLKEENAVIRGSP